MRNYRNTDRYTYLIWFVYYFASTLYEPVCTNIRETTEFMVLPACIVCHHPSPADNGVYLATPVFPRVTIDYMYIQSKSIITLPDRSDLHTL